MNFDDLSNRVIGCAIEAHRHLGPGLLESTYQHCLVYELSKNKISVQTEVAVPVNYKGIRLDCGYRIDLLVENNLIVELKSVDDISGVHKAQLLTYMRLANIPIGLIINFNTEILKDGLRRLKLPPSSLRSSVPSVSSC